MLSIRHADKTGQNMTCEHNLNNILDFIRWWRFYPPGSLNEWVCILFVLTSKLSIKFFSSLHKGVYPNNEDNPVIILT